MRREKINNKLKYLQNIIPGCHEVIFFLVQSTKILESRVQTKISYTVQTMGMAMVLDETINYVHSLQNQVEVRNMVNFSYVFTMFPFNSTDLCTLVLNSVSLNGACICMFLFRHKFWHGSNQKSFGTTTTSQKIINF